MLSICIIAKNEEKTIEKCLKSIEKFPCEIVFVDTGSQDRTKEIAMKYTKRIYDFSWCNDFSAAKNFAISQAKKDYVMILDADEYMEEFDENQLNELLKKASGIVGRIKRRNYYHQEESLRENVEWINRIFHRKFFQYDGKIHEQIVKKNNQKYCTYEAPITIGHTGYDLSLEKKKEKAIRNIKLLESEFERINQQYRENDMPEELYLEQMPYILFQLGKSYYWAKEYKKAKLYFSKGLLFDLNPRLEYVKDMVETYGYTLLELGENKEALMFENIYDDFKDSADFLFLMGLIYMNNARFREAIEEFHRATLSKECHMVGNNSYLAFYNIGVIYQCLGDVNHAREFYQRCGNYELAKVRLQEIR